MEPGRVIGAKATKHRRNGTCSGNGLHAKLNRSDCAQRGISIAVVLQTRTRLRAFTHWHTQPILNWFEPVDFDGLDECPLDDRDPFRARRLRD